MATYVVGDIQGCYDPLMRLLDKANFNANKDTLYCVGDLVNRGPKSLKTLRFLMSLEDKCVTVLGNHDIHLLAMIYGIRKPRTGDTLNKILDASEVDNISTWLRRQPLLYKSKKHKTILCHAGIYPWWTIKKATHLAREVESVFQNENQCRDLLTHIYSNRPVKWSNDLTGVERHRFIINAFTRMRFCSPKGRLNFSDSGYATKITKNRIPWFDYKNSSLDEWRIVFGHWSSAGFIFRRNYLGLDTGCVWGGQLTMAKLPKSLDNPIKIYQERN